MPMMNMDWPRATTWVLPPYVSWTRNSADTYVVVVRVTNACRRQYQKTTNHFFVELPMRAPILSGALLEPPGYVLFFRERKWHGGKETRPRTVDGVMLVGSLDTRQRGECGVLERGVVGAGRGRLLNVGRLLLGQGRRLCGSVCGCGCGCGCGSHDDLAGRRATSKGWSCGVAAAGGRVGSRRRERRASRGRGREGEEDETLPETRAAFKQRLPNAIDTGTYTITTRPTTQIGYRACGAVRYVHGAGIRWLWGRRGKI